MGRSLKAEILEMVQSRGNVTFVEVQNMPGGDGHYEIVLGEGPNVILWQGLSKEAADAVIGLRSEGAIHYVPTPTLTYIIDGAILRLPIVKSPKALARGYKSERWLPVVIQPGRG